METPELFPKEPIQPESAQVEPITEPQEKQPPYTEDEREALYEKDENEDWWHR